MTDDRSALPPRALLAALAAAFALASAPLWRAPLFGEDPMVVSWLRDGGLAEALRDFGRPQYGLSSVRFYRPLVSLSLALQASVSVDPAWLRAANLLAFSLGIAATAVLAWRLGAGRLGAAVAGLWVIAFPGGPGDWCWIVGRVDAFSFGLGMAALAAVAGPREPAPRARIVGIAAALAAACLTKESAFAYGPAAACLAFALRGRRGLPVAAAALLATAGAFVLRAAALDFAAGGYVGAPASPSQLWTALAPGTLASAAGVATGAGAWLGAPIVGIPLAAAALGCLPSASPRGARILPALAWLVLVPCLAGFDPRHAEPIQARLFPGLVAFVGIGWGLLLARWGAPAILRVAAAALPLALPAMAQFRAVAEYGAAALRLARDQASVAQAQRAHPGAPFLAFPSAIQGYPEGRAEVLLYNLGIPERFAPPFAPPGPRVLAMRPAIGGSADAPLALPSDTSWLIATESPVHAGLVLGPPAGGAALLAVALPEALSGRDAEEMAEGRLDRPLDLPSAPPRARLRVVLLTCVGFAWCWVDPAKLTWKELLLSPAEGSRTALYQVVGFAADYRPGFVAFAFDWIAPGGEVLARAAPIPVRIESDFAEYIRRTVADPAFGVGRTR